MNRLSFNSNIVLHKNNINNTSSRTITQKKSFQEIFNNINKSQEVKFSKHAIERLKYRNINLTKEEIDRLNSAIKKAGNKGVKEALILMDNKIFIASVKNHTIITAASNEQLKENIFTNIDGAVII